MSKTLREQLVSGDEVVHFVNPAPPEEAGPRYDALVRAVQTASEVLLVDVTESETQLIYGGRWARTLVCSTIASVYKAPTKSVRHGDERCFEIGGGRLIIDGVTVQVLSGVPYTKDRQYLVMFGPPERTSDIELYPHYGAMPLLKHGDTFLAYPGLSDHLGGITTIELRRALNATR